MTVTSTDPLKLLTTEQVADLLGVSVPTVKRELRAGNLRGLLIQGSRRFRRAEIEAYVEGKVEGGPPPQKFVDGFPVVQSRRGRVRRPK